VSAEVREFPPFPVRTKIAAQKKGVFEAWDPGATNQVSKMSRGLGTALPKKHGEKNNPKDTRNRPMTTARIWDGKGGNTAGGLHHEALDYRKERRNSCTEKEEQKVYPPLVVEKNQQPTTCCSPRPHLGHCGGKRKIPVKTGGR